MLLVRRTWFLIIASLLFVLPSSAQNMDVIIGDWQGTLGMGQNSLRLVFHINADEEGQLITTLDSPDQGANGIPTSTTNWADGQLDVEVAMVGGSFSGTLENEEIKGTWSQGGGSVPIVLKRMTEPIVFNRPQEPKAPYPYTAEVVRYANEEARIELEGTLTLPEGGGPHPAVILISGSGPQDRDESLMGHKPFLVLADYLTRNGIAVLRYDDRGVGQSGGDFGAATTLDFVTDVEAAMNYLEGRSDIVTRSIGLIGHSEGGLIAPMVATESGNNTAFVVMLAGPGLTGKEVLLTQNAKMLSLNGMNDTFIDRLNEINGRLYDTVIASEGSAAKEALKNELVQIRAELSEMEVSLMGLTEERDEQIVSQLSSAWMKQFMELDPSSYLQQLTVPTLSIIGEKDVQVLPEENSKAIEEALLKAGNTDYTIEILPGLNHLFQNAETGLPNEYAKIEETFSEDVMELITNWIKERL